MNIQHENPPENSGKVNYLKGKLKTFFATIGVLSVTLFILFFVGLFFLINSVSTSIKSFSTSLNPAASFGKTNGIGGFTKPHLNSQYIAGVTLNGEISADSSAIVVEKLEAAKNDKNVVGILFDVNSPGGSVVPSQEIYDTIKKIKQIKPVVTYVRDIAASGAYYSSSSSSKIIANRGSIIGSIGVIMNSFEVDKLLQFLKINPVVLKTGALKDSLSPFRPFNEKDKQYLQELLEETRLQFVEDVKAERKTSDSTMKYMADGRIVLGPQALNLKLIDALGTKDFAISEIANLAKLKNTPPLYYYEDIQSFSDLFTQKLASQTAVLMQQSITNLFSQSAEKSNSIKAK